MKVTLVRNLIIMAILLAGTLVAFTPTGANANCPGGDCCIDLQQACKDSGGTVDVLACTPNDIINVTCSTPRSTEPFKEVCRRCNGIVAEAVGGTVVTCLKTN